MDPITQGQQTDVHVGMCSLAILTDAAHLLSDVSGFGVALFANYVASQSNLSTHTFG